MYVGDIAPITLNASYDNGDVASGMNVRVIYVTDEKDVISISGNAVRAIKPGNANIAAFVSDGGKVLKTDPVAIEVYTNVLGSIQVSLEKSTISVGETASVITDVYNAQGIAIDPSRYGIIYSSDNESIASVSSNGMVTGMGVGTANITAKVTFEGTSLQETIPVTVTGRRTLLSDDFEGYPDGAVGNAADIGAYEIVNIQVEPLYLPTYPQKGLTGLFDGGDAGWQGKYDGYVIYRFDSTDPSGFKKLTLSYMGRAVSLPSVGADGKVIISAGEDPANLQQIGEIEQGAPMNTVYNHDLTDIVQGKNTIYIRVDIKAGRLTWAFLDSIMVEEEY